MVSAAGIPVWLQAGLWGLLSGGALLVGAVVGFKVKLPKRLIADIMAFGAGVLISALAFELMEEAFKEGGLKASAFGMIGGAFIYSLANWALSKHGAKNRKRSEPGESAEDEDSGSGAAIALGALLDGIPESIAIGLSMLTGGAVSIVTVVAIFISNVPEGLSSSAGMKKSGRSAGFVFGLWAVIAIISSLSAMAGYTLFGNVSPQWRAATTGVAAGAILAMIAETMIPEAFEGNRNLSGLITVCGFLCAFTLSMMAL